jgi:hypothetical protein
MRRFEISEPRDDKPDDSKQKEYRKTSRFSPITHADQPSTSAGHEKEGVQLKGEQSTYSDVLAEDLTGHHDGVILVKWVIKELGKAKELSLEVKNNGWNKLTLENIVEDKSYAEYAHQCSDEFNKQFDKCIDLVNGRDTYKQYDKKAINQILADLVELNGHYEKVIIVKNVIELVQARKNFKEKGDPETALSVKRALEKFKPPQNLIDNYKRHSASYWIKESISEVNDELICGIIDKVIDNERINNRLCEKDLIQLLDQFYTRSVFEPSYIASEKLTLANLDEELNGINTSGHSVDDSVIVFEEGNETIKFGWLREKWSKKEWFSRLDDRQMLYNGQIKEIVKEYYESYMKTVDKRVQDLVQEGDPQIWIRCKPETLLRILECGRFKSQFETNTSNGGNINKKRRAKLESGVAGIPLNMPAPFRFIYGYATTNSNGECRNVEHYGSVAVCLKPELKEFALQMLDDSLGSIDCYGNLIRKPTFFADADRCCLSLKKPNPFEIQGRKDLEGKIRYQEAQILRVDKEDIQEVVFYPRSGPPELKKAFTKLLEQHGIRSRIL